MQRDVEDARHQRRCGRRRLGRDLTVERAQQLTCAEEAALGIRVHGAADELVVGLADVRRHRARRGGGLRLSLHDREGIGAVEGGPPREHLEQRRAQRVEIRARVGAGSREQFGRHVARRPEQRALRGEPRPACRPREPKVEQLDGRAARALHEHHVLRLEIAVHDPALMRRRERLRHPARDEHRLIARHRALGEAIGQRDPAQQLHREKRPDAALRLLVPVEIEDAHDAGVIEAARDAHLAQEAQRQFLVVGEVRVQDLDRDLLAGHAVARCVHLGQPARAERTQHLEAAGDDLAFGEGAHAAARPGSPRRALRYAPESGWCPPEPRRPRARA